MATVVVHHTVTTGAPADTSALVDGPAWDAAHTVTGLENVDNTSDANKPVSTAQAAALALKLAIASNLSDLASVTTSRSNLGAFGVIRVQKFTASGTYTPNANMLYCIIECVGGGGGGGATVGSATGSRGGGGGGSGGYSIKVASKATIGASQTVTIGAGGNGGTAGTNAGAAGGDTSVGTLCVAKGGSGGNYNDQAGGYGEAGAGAVAGTGDFAGVGQYGSVGLSASITTVLAIGGLGGVPFFGGGAPARLAASGSNLAGFNAQGVGGGGGGAGTCGTATNSAGGGGGAGYVFITEFCSQ